jgi:hypothetical protein
VEPSFDRPLRAGQTVGDICFTEPEVVAKDDSGPLARRELDQGVVHHLALLGPLQRPLTGSDKTALERHAPPL